MRRATKRTWILLAVLPLPALATSAVMYSIACQSAFLCAPEEKSDATAGGESQAWDEDDYYDFGASGDSGGQSPIPIVGNTLQLEKAYTLQRPRSGGRGPQSKTPAWGFVGGDRYDDFREKLAAYPGTLPSEEEELWIIQKPDEDAPRDPRGPGCGALLCRLPNVEETVPVPLEHTDVDASISAYIATVDVTQKFANPYDQKIEAVYVFPLPQNAAINEFIMTVGDRKIRGIIRDREEAQRIYNAAKQQGHVASLLTQERANVFTQKVANIEPGKKIDINIKYFHTLAYDDGWYEFVFPMVVGPRYNPPGSTDGIGAVPVGGRGRSGQSTEVEYLAPNQRSGHDISLAVTIDAGVPVKQSRSVNHVVETRMDAQNRTLVGLSDRDSIPNKDFVLRYKVVDDRINSALLTHRDETGSYFTLMMYPPESLGALDRRPVELIFVLDCSGSMSGKPIEQAKKAIERGIRSLRASDTFQIIRFSNDASQLGAVPVLATRSNIRKGLKYLRKLEGEGGTQMIEGIEAALDFPHDEERLRFVCFMTDGFIGNEAEILGEVHQRLGASRIFSFGVGSSPNRYLLNRMAKLGNGAVAYLSLNDSGADVMDRFFERISHPAMTDIRIDWGGLQVSEVFPERVPDLFVGRPVILSGRFDGAATGSIRISGNAGGKDRDIFVSTNASSGTHPGLASVWARTKIADIADRGTYEPQRDVAGEIRQVALNYGLMSQFTAFVAVDSLTRTTGAQGTTVRVPVPVPDGVKYETTVTE